MSFDPDDTPAAPTAGPTKAPPLGDLVYLGLKARILGHGFRMGDPLREDEVATIDSVPDRETAAALGQEMGEALRARSVALLNL